MKAINELIDERLWNEIKRHYLAEEYTDSVLDAIQFLGDLIREMSGEDGDGYNMISNVFNEHNPKIKINHLRTKTDKNIQKGVMLLLQGFYSAIRNERVHEKKRDNEEEANELILFINHLLRIIDKSKGKFTVEKTLRRVFDKSFLPKKEYVQYLIEEIPDSKKYEVALRLFRNRKESKHLDEISIFWNELRKGISDPEVSDLIEELSEELRYTDDSKDIISAIKLLGADWINIVKDSKLRSEHLLIKSLPSFLSEDPREGPDGSVFTEEATCLSYLYTNELLDLQTELAEKVFSSFKRGGFEMNSFIIKNFGGYLLEFENEVLLEDLEKILIEKVKSNDPSVIKFVERTYGKEISDRILEHVPPEITGNDLPF